MNLKLNNKQESRANGTVVKTIRKARESALVLADEMMAGFWILRSEESTESMQAKSMLTDFASACTSAIGRYVYDGANPLTELRKHANSETRRQIDTLIEQIATEGAEELRVVMLDDKSVS